MNTTNLREEFKKKFDSFIDPDDIADFFLSKFSTYQQELLEKVMGMRGITTTRKNEDTTMIRMGNKGGLNDYVDSKEYINKVDVLKALSEVEKIIQNHA